MPLDKKNPDLSSKKTRVRSYEITSLDCFSLVKQWKIFKMYCGFFIYERIIDPNRPFEKNGSEYKLSQRPNLTKTTGFVSLSRWPGIKVDISRSLIEKINVEREREKSGGRKIPRPIPSKRIN